MDNFEQQAEQSPTSLLAETPPIEESRNQILTSKDDIKKLIEQPLLDACEIFWDLNIQTLSSSANQKDLISGEVYIIIDFDHLSEENQNIAQKYSKPIDYDGRKAIKITIPVSKKTTVEDISKKTTEIANSFKKQLATWIPTYTLEMLKQAYGIDPNEKSYDDLKIWQEEGFYYDPESKLFYLSEEHYNKANVRL